MKKIIIIFILCFVLLGCTKNITAPEVVSHYLNNYINLDDDVVKSIDDAINNNDEYCNSCKSIYKDILKKQYKTMEYNIISEEYDNNKAIIKVGITVIDLKKAEDLAQNELIPKLQLHYNDDNKVNEELYYKDKYKLMLSYNEKVNYEIYFYLEKRNNNWILIDPTEDDLMKIHGIY